MAQSVQQQRASYPLAAYNFRVTIGTEAKSFAFARVSGLQLEYQTVTYRHGLSSFVGGEDLTKFYSGKYISVTLERGITDRSSFLKTWLEDKSPRAMAISLCDENGTPVLSWRIARAFAVKLSAPTFDARTNEVAIETLEVKAAGISIVPNP